MPEKELDSMATVQIKPDYAASEVYSTTSEPPPAYKRQSTSVQIARIVAFTVIISSFIIGCFILASAYLQARASCDQMQALDSVLEKELMLEALQQTNKEIPRAEALIGNNNLNKESDELDLQNLDKDDSPTDKKNTDDVVKSKVSESTATTKDENESDSSLSSSDSDESDDMKQVKVPLELDLSELAAALLENNQKSRMNCVVERKHAEELVDSPAKTMQLPFGMNLTTDPKKAKITGERISIFCESGNENDNKRHEDAESIRPMFMPFGPRFPIPYGAQPQQIPLTHMPQNMQPPQIPQYQIHQIPPPFQQMPIRPPMPPQFIQAPRPEPQLRIQVQRIPIREIHIPQEIAQEIQGNSNEMPQIQVQRVPLGVALERAGITADDLRNIQRMAEERITDELRRIAAEEAISNSEASSSDDSSNEEDDEPIDSQSQSNEQPSSAQTQQASQQSQQQQQSESSQSSQQQEQQQQESEQPSEPQQTLNPPMPEQPLQMLQIGRNGYGRSLPTPVRIPVPMMQSQESQESTESERPHFVQPRSVRSVDSVLKNEKRAKRFACNCEC